LWHKKIFIANFYKTDQAWMLLSFLSVGNWKMVCPPKKISPKNAKASKTVKKETFWEKKKFSSRFRAMP
jgi:hypothetical protein